jgi:hypothetical protein
VFASIVGLHTYDGLRAYDLARPFRVDLRFRKTKHLTKHMPIELFGILGPLTGALVGGLIAFFATRATKRHEWRLSIAKEQSAARLKIYAQFVAEAQRMSLRGRIRGVTELEEYDPLNGLFAEITLVAPEHVISAARTLADAALTVSMPPTANENREFFALKERFISAAREDIDSTLNQY